MLADGCKVLKNWFWVQNGKGQGGNQRLSATFAAPAANSENIPVKDAFPGLTSV